jgi:AraC-like DNA-binding protein
MPSEASLGPILHELIDLHRQKSIRNEWIASKYLVELLTELLLAGPEYEAFATNIPEYVVKIKQLIEKRYNEQLSLEYMSKLLAINKYHMAKEFKKYTGFSPGEYIINTRISRAKEILKYSNLSISEIAEQIGIENSSHFFHLFKSRVEQTPLAFRKQWRQF